MEYPVNPSGQPREKEGCRFGLLEMDYSRLFTIGSHTNGIIRLI